MRPATRALHRSHPVQSIRASSILALILCLAAVPLAAQPTVNGLFYGDGDDALYSLYATSQNGSELLTYYDAGSTTLYVALVVSHNVNDLVCSPKSNSAYTSSATPPWGGHRTCKRASDSEFATFTFECAPGSPTKSWTWQQALGCTADLTPPLENWVSDSSCGPSSPAADWAPGVEANATTSWVTNVNTYQAAASGPRAWNLYAFGTGLDTGWKSPFVSSAPNDVTQVPGYPTYSSTDGMGNFYEWEWSMVYEWSIDVGPSGVDCGDETIVFISGLSHHSPGKHGSENDPFDPPENPEFSDWGDLPDTYGTLSGSSGARHLIKANGPYLGVDLLPELDGSPTSDATGDGGEEDGVTANVTGDWTAGSTQTFDVVVSNAPAGGALLAAWFDWNNDGDFDDAGEYFTWSGLSNGTHTLSVTVGSGFDWETDNLYARFRIFSDASHAPGGSLTQADSVGTATDGEVEDHRWAPGSLPVTLNAFSSRRAGDGTLTVRWQTASETENVAFQLIGRVDGEWRALEGLIESSRGTSALPQSYEARLEAPSGLTELRLVDYDLRGRPERYGSFRVGKRYGEFQPARTIDWSGPRTERAERLAERGFAAAAGSREVAKTRGAASWKKLRAEPVGGLAARRHGAERIAVPVARRASQAPLDAAPGAPSLVEVATGPVTHVAVTESGIQRVTYEALRAGGLDLRGVPARQIALTWRGRAVPRWIDGGPTFGPGSAIEFLGRAPAGDDALYVEAAHYQVAVDAERARPVGRLGRGRAPVVSPWYLAETWVDRPARFNPQSPTGDPWIERTVLARGGLAPAVVTLDLPVAGPVSDALAYLVVGLGTITDLPDVRGADGRVLPEHNVEVWLRRPDGSRIFVTAAAASGQRDWRIEATLPQGVLQAGLNQVELQFSTDYFFSLVAIDRYGVRFPTPYRGPALDFTPDARASGYAIEGFSTPAVIAYAEGAGGSLTRLEPQVTAAAHDRSGAPSFSVELRSMAAERFWVTESPHVPAVFTTEAAPDLLSGSADLVVIAGSSFIGSPALDDYLAARAHLDPVVVDVEDVYNAVGYGMALPSAITDFLAARDAVRPFTHVQLVGADCYDRRGYVSDCVSFVPLPTARVGVSRYTPSQNRLVDLDGDGVGDKAVGQFSVRDTGELSMIVRKAEAWEASGLAAGGSALLIAEESDGLHDFAAQLDRLAARLGWSDTHRLRLADHPDIQTARAFVRSSLDSGRSVTTFSGHSSPSVWAFRGLLTPDSVAELTNVHRPTIMVPLACETTYDVSPSANVLGHQLLFGGNSGALAISGAAALANLRQNELMAGHVLEGLDSGLTLGEAVLAGRRALGPAFRELQDNWITQGDVAIGLAP